ncbi:MAG: hypothetical protein HN514_04160 [Candidatus Marinimicrobia bacterium]|jgi:Tol biopolymer transport system component|nr:hypothetical protein [Candidatus Neomarinimicrobiota bacterium]
MKKKKMTVTILLISLFGLSGCNESKPTLSPDEKPTKVINQLTGTVPGYDNGEWGDYGYHIEMVESSPNAKSVTKITLNNDNLVNISDPAHHPSAQTIIYSEYRKPDQDNIEYDRTSVIWSQVPTKNARVRVTESTYNNGEAVFNNDGESIVFTSARSNNNEGIWRIKSNGLGGILKLTEFGSSKLGHPTIGRNDQIAFHAIDPRYKNSYNNGDNEIRPFIWLMSSDGSIPTQLRYGQYPEFSPDGNTIVFSRKDVLTGKKQIFTMNTNGGRITQLTYNVDYDIKDPFWHPTGDYIVYASNEGKTNEMEDDTLSLSESIESDFNIWVMSMDGSQQTQLTTNQSHDDQPVFSPSGEFIYFRSNRGGFWNIWRFEPIF